MKFIKCLCYSPPERNFFRIPEPFDLLKWNFGSVNKILLGTVSSQNHTSLQHLLMPKWLILKRSQTSKVNFLIFYVSFIRSPIRNMIRPWNFLKHVSLTKEVDWWHHFQFMTTSSKIGAGLQITYQSHDIVNDATSCP